MTLWLAVLVDNRELVRFLRVEEGSTSVINLTTMVPNQDRVYIELFAVQGRRRQQVHSFHASNILRGRDRPEIVLSAHVRGTVQVSLRIDGELVDQATISAPESIPREKQEHARGAVLFAVLALLLIGALGGSIWWLTRANGLGIGRTPAGQRPGTQRERAIAEEPADTAGPVNTESHAEAQPEAQPDEPPDASGPVTDPEAAEDAPLPEPPEPVIVLFEPEQSALTSETRSALASLASRIVEDLGGIGGSNSERVQVAIVSVGHTALYDDEASRLELSFARAEAVGEFLEARLQPALSGVTVTIATDGLGGTRPVTRAEELQWRNRRVVVLVRYSTQSTVSD